MAAVGHIFIAVGLLVLYILSFCILRLSLALTEALGFCWWCLEVNCSVCRLHCVGRWLIV